MFLLCDNLLLICSVNKFIFSQTILTLTNETTNAEEITKKN